MSGLRVPAHRLLAAVAANAARCPLPAHHVPVYAALAHGKDILTDGDIWMLNAFLKLARLSENQQGRLRGMECKVARGRSC